MQLSLSQESSRNSDTWYFQREKWPMYRCVIAKAQERGVPFAMGGGFAQMAYAGCVHVAKDMDIFVLPSDRTSARRWSASGSSVDPRYLWTESVFA